MDSKIVGYILSGVGLFGILVSTPNVIKAVPFLTSLPNTVIKYFLIGSIMCVGVGIVLIMSKGTGSKFHPKTKMGEEVPIFKGKEIVGYRITK